VNIHYRRFGGTTCEETFVKLRSILLGGVCCLALIAGCGPREKIVARVGREKITSQDFKDEFLRRYRSEDNAQRQPYPVREKVVRDMATERAMYLEGCERGLDKRQQVTDQVDQLARRQALDMLYQTQVMDKVVTEAAARKFYDMGSQEVKARHILLKTSPTDTAHSDTAKVLARLDSVKRAIAAGLDFKTAAAKFSEDATSAADSGDLGWFQWGRMVDQFQQAAWKTDAGKMVGPVRTPYGYHLIFVEQKRPVAGRPAYETVKEQVKTQMRDAEGQKLNETARAYVEELHKSRKLVYNQANLDVFRKRVLDPTVSQTQALGPMFTAEQKALVAATYKGGKVTVDSLIQKVGSNAARVNWNDPQSVLDLVHAVVEPKFLQDDAEAKGFYRKALHSPTVEAERRRAVTALLEKEEITDKVQPTTDDERRFYESHLASFIQPEMRTVREIFFKDDSVKAARVRERALGGQDFTKLAIKFNEKESTQPDTGRLGPFEERLFGLIGKTAFALKNVGDVSAVLRIGKSFSVIQLLAVMPSRTKTFEEAQADVKRQARQTMTDDRRKALEETVLKKFKVELDAKALAAVWPLPEKPEDKISRQP
jgi:parvulin-like peptidyl-prolyl isomerase